MATKQEQELHVVMFPFFAFGHISPFVQLANKLSFHGARVSFLSHPDNIKTSLHLTPMAQIIPLQIPSVEGLPPGLHNTSEMTPYMAELLKKALDLTQPQIETLLSQLKPHLVIFDFVQHWLPKLASKLGIKTVHFSVFSAISGAYLIVPARVSTTNKIPTVDDLLNPPTGFPSTSVTSVKAFEAEDFLYVFKSFDGGPAVIDRYLQCFGGCDAVVFKTCNELEGPYVDYVRTQYQKPVLLAGPLVPEPASGELDEKWAKWLGQFDPQSVIFCSFGSETFLSDEQIEQLALGLELTGLPFALVLNFPAGVDAQAELNRTLPQGFTERVKGRVMVHTGWIQQPLILAHKSVGCYVCHSGFSSVIESLLNECQMVLLPMKGDQFLNSRLLAGDLKVCVEINRRNEDGYFRKEDIKEAVKAIMMEVEKEPYKSIRANRKKLKEFLLNPGIQDKFIEDLVVELKALS